MTNMMLRKGMSSRRMGRRQLREGGPVQRFRRGNRGEREKDTVSKGKQEAFDKFRRQ